MDKIGRLKMCSLHKGSFYGDILDTFQQGVYREKYPYRLGGSVSGIIYFCVYIKSVPSRLTKHMFINT